MNNIRKLSIIIPVYNEEKTIVKSVEKLLSVKIGKVKKEIIIIDDGSTDKTAKLIRKLKKQYSDLISIFQQENGGKGSAIRTALKKVTGDAVVIQDADLEYDPNDFVRMVKKMLENSVQVVYGSRRLNKNNIQYSGLSYYWGGYVLTILSNILYRINLTDEPTCYKMFDTKLLKSLPLKSERFEFCPEVTALVSKKGIKIEEVPISYHPRNARQGKKIKARDFIEAVSVLLKYRLSNAL